MRSEGVAGSRAEGFTLVEMLLAIVVIGIGVAGVLMAFNATVMHSTDPLVDKQLLAIAEEIMEEIELQPYASSTAKAVSGCARAGFVKVADYDGYVTNGKICDVDGLAIAGLSGYSVSVSVQVSPLGGVSEALKIVVTTSRGASSLKLVSWRTNFAG